jgi:hypothetical protein
MNILLFLALASGSVGHPLESGKPVAKPKESDIKQRHGDRMVLEAALLKQEGELRMHELQSRLRGREMKLEIRKTESDLNKLKRSISGHKVRDVVLKLILPILLLAVVSILIIYLFRKNRKVILVTLAADIVGLIIISITYHFVKV